MLTVLLLSGAFAGTSLAADSGAPAPLAGSLWQQWLPDGSLSVRTITQGSVCPVASLNRQPVQMTLRAAPGQALRHGKRDVVSDFPVTVCELQRQRSDTVVVDGTTLPAPAPVVRRMIVIGDTGCRIKASESAYQNCDDPQAWPFATVIRSAVNEAADLVVHVGDYHYRESLCPSDQPCAGSVWGYGWDAWKSDFFDPAGPLLRAVPWVVARGNHEECARAGQGYARFLSVQAVTAGLSCDDAQSDLDANHGAPYAVDLGEGWQLIVFDSAYASHTLDAQRSADAAHLDRFRKDFERVRELASRPGVRSIFVSHHPYLALSQGKHAAAFGNPTLLAPMSEVNGPALQPDGVALGLHGHLHLFEAVNFASGQAPELVAGHGGDLLDQPIDGNLAQAPVAMPGATVDSLVYSRRFGYLVLERQAQGWRILGRQTDGTTLTQCELDPAARRIRCDDRVRVDRP